MEEQFKVYNDKSSHIILPRMQYLCACSTASIHKYSHDRNIRDYILELTTDDVEYNASFITYLSNVWYKYRLSIDYAGMVSKMNLPGFSKKLIHPLSMRIGGLYEIHDIHNTGTINRGIYRLKDINDCVYYFSRIKGGTTIFQHDILSEDVQMCKDRVFFEVNINREVIDKW
jgi:hypothetical protein